MNKDKKTLVILTPGFAKDESDSVCLPMQQQLVRTLCDMNPQLNIILLSFQYPYHIKKYTWFNTTVIPFNGQNKGGIKRLLLRKKITTTLKKIHRETPVNGLLSFWYGECALVGKQFANTNGLNHFCWILGQDARKENKYPQRTQPRPGELIALSDFLQTAFEKNHGIKPDHLITAGIDIKQFNSGKSEKDIDILGVGSLIPLKQYDVFIEIVVEIKNILPHVKAVLIGKGPEMKKLQSLISRAGLETTITLTGEIPYPEVLQYMQRAKILLHPSAYEGFSGVCLEALYAGAHVISFCKAMNQDIEQWHIVTSKEEMTQKAVSILENPYTYKRVIFSEINDVARKIMQLFL